MGDLNPQGGRLAPGTVLAGYRIEGPLGSGGMGVVYRATQLSLKRAVALKVLSADLAFDSDARERFLQEGVLAARVAHPRLVRVLHVGETQHRLFLAYELIDGGTLRQKLADSGPLGVSEALEVAVACADVLATLHKASILHRDLKPENIFMHSERGAMIGDLGIAKDLLHSKVKTQHGFMLGTPFYMAPEMVKGELASPATDLYAAGIVLFECLAGKPPFVAPNTQGVLRLHVKEAVPSLCALRPGLPASFDRLLSRLLAKDPRERYPTAEALLAALSALQERGPADATVLNLASGPGLRAKEKAALAIHPTLSASRRSPGESGSPRPSLPKPEEARRQLALVAVAGLALLLGGLFVGLRLVNSGNRAVTVPPRALPAAAPIKDDPAGLAIAAYERALQALRVVRQTSTAEHAANARKLATLDRDASLDRALQLFKKGVLQVEQALPALSAFEASASSQQTTAASGGGAAMAGRLLQELFLIGDFGRAQVWDTITAMAQRTDPAWSLFSLSLESVASAMLSRLAKEVVGFLARIPPSLLQSTDTRWRAGHLGMRSLSRHALSRNQIERLGLEVTDAGRELVDKVLRSDRADLTSMLILALAIRSVVYVGAIKGTRELCDRVLTGLEMGGPNSRLGPARELYRYEAKAAFTRLVLRSNIADMDRLTNEEKQLKGWAGLRDRLLDRWPYELRAPRPSEADGAPRDALDLHEAACERLEEARQLGAVASRKQGSPLPAEPKLR